MFYQAKGPQLRPYNRLPTRHWGFHFSYSLIPWYTKDLPSDIWETWIICYLLFCILVHLLQPLSSQQPLPVKEDCAVCNRHMLQTVHLQVSMIGTSGTYIVKGRCIDLKHFDNLSTLVIWNQHMLLSGMVQNLSHLCFQIPYLVLNCKAEQNIFSCALRCIIFDSTSTRTIISLRLSG